MGHSIVSHSMSYLVGASCGSYILIRCVTGCSLQLIGSSSPLSLDYIMLWMS